MSSISIVVVNYNQAHFLPVAWESIESQLLDKEDQIFIVDDGSQESDFKKIQEFLSKNVVKNIDVIHDGENLGISGRLNRLLPLITTDWIVVIAADDFFSPDGLSHLRNAIEKDISFIWGNLAVVNQAGELTGRYRPRGTWIENLAKKYEEANYPRHDLLRYNNFISGGMTLMRVSSVRELDGWDSSVTTEDYDLWLRAGEKYRFRFVDKVVGNYRVVENSKSRLSRHKLEDNIALLSKWADSDPYGVLKMLAMRWAFTAARTKRLPHIGLLKLADGVGLPRWKVVAIAPWAIIHPVLGSIRASVRRLTRDRNL